MTLPGSAADVLAGRVTLEVECIDRMYLNVYQPRLQFVAGVVSFLRKHRGYPIASSALLEPISREFVADIHSFARDHGVAMVDFAKGPSSTSPRGCCSSGGPRNGPGCFGPRSVGTPSRG
jgi:hypothetical protein